MDVTYIGYCAAIKVLALAEMHRLDDGCFSFNDRHTLSVVILSEENEFCRTYGCTPSKYLHTYSLEQVRTRRYRCETP